MPAAVRGAASPWFTGAGSDLLVVKVSIKYLYATTSKWITDRLTKPPEKSIVFEEV